MFGASSRQAPHAPPHSTHRPDPLYIIVFGYPLDKYSVTLEYFQSLGDATEGDPNADIVNCFRIGYYDPGDAMRAVRKNGEVIGGSFMVGAKWAVSKSRAVVSVLSGIHFVFFHVYAGPNPGGDADRQAGYPIRLCILRVPEQHHLTSIIRQVQRHGCR